jgi:hypothetical protein
MDAGDDTLITRLRDRAADPNRRTDLMPTAFADQVGGMSLDELRLHGGSIAGDLSRLVSSIQSGSAIDPQLHERAESVAADMSRPAARALPAPATDCLL